MIDYSQFAQPKPRDIEGVVVLTKAQKKALRVKYFVLQGAICGCGCERRMTLELGRMDTATLEHTVPRSAGCVKNDDPETNLTSVWRWDCNSNKGSRRL